MVFNNSGNNNISVAHISRKIVKWINAKEALNHGLLSVDGIMQKVCNREQLTVREEEYLYHHGTVAQISDAFKHYPVLDIE